MGKNFNFFNKKKIIGQEFSNNLFFLLKNSFIIYNILFLDLLLSIQKSIMYYKKFY
jgi:hypothetical protein